MRTRGVGTGAAELMSERFGIYERKGSSAKVPLMMKYWSQRELEVWGRDGDKRTEAGDSSRS